jgi:MFS family permease
MFEKRLGLCASPRYRARTVTTPETTPAVRVHQLFGVPREVVMLGIVSFLTDVSSEAIFAILPLFLTGVMGASTLVLGTMEGLADFSASSLDLASGYLSDRIGKRKGLAVLGYGLSSVAKTVLIFASTTGQIFAFRVVERLGKSIRGAPRDALLAGVAPKEKRGASFGVHKAFDKAGAILGPLMAFALLEHFGQSLGSFRKLFLVALIPAFASVAVLVIFVHERKGAAPQRVPLREALRTLGPGFRHYLISAGLFSGAYFSYAFLMLAAARAHFESKHVALLYALFNVSFTVLSAPIGRLGDRIGRRAIIAVSYGLYALLAVGFALATSKTAVILLFLVYGVFYAIDEGQTKAYIADLVPEKMRATAIGTYGFVTALIYLPASLVAGLLWKTFGPEATFGAAASVALVALVYFLVFQPRASMEAL